MPLFNLQCRSAYDLEYAIREILETIALLEFEVIQIVLPCAKDVNQTTKRNSHVIRFMQG